MYDPLYASFPLYFRFEILIVHIFLDLLKILYIINYLFTCAILFDIESS